MTRLPYSFLPAMTFQFLLLALPITAAVPQPLTSVDVEKYVGRWYQVRADSRSRPTRPSNISIYKPPLRPPQAPAPPQAPTGASAHRSPRHHRPRQTRRPMPAPRSSSRSSWAATASPPTTRPLLRGGFTSPSPIPRFGRRDPKIPQHFYRARSLRCV